MEKYVKQIVTRQCIVGSWLDSTQVNRYFFVNEWIKSKAQSLSGFGGVDNRRGRVNVVICVSKRSAADVQITIYYS